MKIELLDQSRHVEYVYI